MEYSDDVSTPTSYLTNVKCLISIILSMKKEKGLVADIKYFYLNTRMIQFEYMRMKLDIIPDENITQ